MKKSSLLVLCSIRDNITIIPYATCLHPRSNARRIVELTAKNKSEVEICRCPTLEMLYPEDFSRIRGTRRISTGTQGM